MSSVPAYRLYGEKSPESGEFWLHCETLFSRSSLHRFEIDLHFHENFMQILYIEEGQGDAMLNGRSFSILPPSVIVVPAGIVHGFRFSRTIKGVIVTVLPAALPLAVRAGLKQAFPLPLITPVSGKDEDVDIAAVMERIADEYAGDRPGRNALLEAYLATVALLLSRRASADSPLARPAPVTDDRRMERLSALIAAHFRDHRTASFYAREMGLSATHLNRIVKAGTGLSLQQVIAKKQLETAQQELIFSHSSIQAIALNLGFADPAYFSRFFTRQTGLTPRTWRLAERRKLQDLTDRSQAEVSAAGAEG